MSLGRDVLAQMVGIWLREVGTKPQYYGTYSQDEKFVFLKPMA